MQAVRLKLFGTPALTQAAGDEPLVPERPTQLAVVLATRREWTTRDRLIVLLWPGLDDESARRNLRKLLFRARRQPWLGGLEVRTDALRWCVECDLHDFEAACAQQDWTRAAATYAGVFCEGFEHKATEPFVEWLRFERGRLTAAYRAALAHRLAQLGNDAPARESLARQWLAFDRLDEDALAALVDALRAQARGGEAQRAINDFAQRVKDELGVESSARIRALGDASQAAAPREAVLRDDQSFIGRRAELSEVQTLLAREQCRLLTITGPGGVGKSRLAKEALPALAVRFTDGVRWIALDDLTDPSQAVARLAAELDVIAERDLLQAVCGHLRSRRVALVLDNCEHLPGLARVLERLFAEAPGVKICATSRTRLGAQGEWLLPLGGLSLPAPDEGPQQVLSSESAQLFVAAARAVKPDFDATREAHDIGVVARAVGGMPLALLLAANWARLLPVAEIAAELAHSLDVLESAEEGEERPEHRSVRATFEQSWRLLTPMEQTALASLSVFAGTFSREAARHVAGASLPLLGALADKSLLVLEGERCSLHPLIRRFAAERSAEQIKVAEQRHAEYYCSMMAGYAHGGKVDQHAGLAQLGPEFSEALAATRWALRHDRAELAGPAALVLAQLFDLTGRAEEGLTVLGTSPPLPTTPTRMQLRAHAHGTIGRATLLARLARFAEAADEARLALRSYRGAADAEGVRLTLSILSTMAVKCGRYEESRRYCEQGLRLAERDSDQAGIATFLNNLGQVERELGLWDAAIEHYQRALRVSRTIDYPLGIIAQLCNIGAAQIGAGRSAAALEPLREGLRLVEEAGFTALRGYFMLHLGRAHLALGAIADARRYAEQGAAAARAQADQINLPLLLLVSAQIAEIEGRIGDACALQRDAAVAACSTQHHAAWVQCLLARAGLLQANGDPEGAVRLAACVEVSALTSRVDHAKATALTAQAATVLPASRLRLVRDQAATRTIEEALAQIAADESVSGVMSGATPEQRPLP
jgi:predicted ATPase/DNA-binding SARP family transcriptional activator